MRLDLQRLGIRAIEVTHAVVQRRYFEDTYATKSLFKPRDLPSF